MGFPFLRKHNHVFRFVCFFAAFVLIFYQLLFYMEDHAAILTKHEQIIFVHSIILEDTVLQALFLSICYPSIFLYEGQIFKTNSLKEKN